MATDTQLISPSQPLRDARQLKTQLEEKYGHPLQLKINDNRSTLIAFTPTRASSPARLSLHRMFLKADDAVVQALAQYICSPTLRCRKVLRLFMNSRSADLESKKTARLNLRSRGVQYDLNRLAEEVNKEFFGGRVDARITWGRGVIGSAKRRQHITFGSYCSRLNLIRIHPALDSSTTPAFFVRFVIYHEMLHAILDPRHDADGRRCLHSSEFRKLEEQHPDFARSKHWECEFLRS